MFHFPFEATIDQISENPGPYVEAVCALLESEFLIMPKGEGFVEYSVFEGGYEALKVWTEGFSVISGDLLLKAAGDLE